MPSEYNEWMKEGEYEFDEWLKHVNKKEQEAFERDEQKKELYDSKGSAEKNKWIEAFCNSLTPKQLYGPNGKPRKIKTDQIALILEYFELQKEKITKGDPYHSD
jgi:hypothetical protein